MMMMIVVRNRLPKSSRESQWENHAVVLPLIVSPVLRTGEAATHYNLSVPICPTGEGGRIDNSSHLSCRNRMASELWVDIPFVWWGSHMEP